MEQNVKNSINEVIDALFESKDHFLSEGSIKDLPSIEKVVEIVEDVKNILYPNYFCKNYEKSYYVDLTKALYEKLYKQIELAFGYECEISKKEINSNEIDQKAKEISLNFIKALPSVFETLSYDIKATLDGDPAAVSPDLILMTYPGIEAVFIYRLAHVLFKSEVPLIPRIMTEYAHSKTGIDIHPGATIGKSFVIDHGTGIVIGETTEIGEHVNIYQGVTLGAVSLKNARSLVGKKRHPTIKDNVTIYSGATILGGETIIGEGAVIGSSVFITKSVEAGVTVAIEKPKLRLYSNNPLAETVKK